MEEVYYFTQTTKGIGSWASFNNNLVRPQSKRKYETTVGRGGQESWKMNSTTCRFQSGLSRKGKNDVYHVPFLRNRVVR